jgi:hypothetical protein
VCAPSPRFFFPFLHTFRRWFGFFSIVSFSFCLKFAEIGLSSAISLNISFRELKERKKSFRGIEAVIIGNRTWENAVL